MKHRRGDNLSVADGGGVMSATYQAVLWNRQVLGVVGEQLRIRGALISEGDVFTLYADPESYKRYYQ